MRPPKTLCWIVLVAMLPQLTGCRSFYPMEGERLANVHPNRVVRVTSVDGSSVDLRGFWADSVLVGGVPKEDDRWISTPRIEIPIEDVDGIEERRISAGKTVTLAAVLLVATAGLVAWFISSALEEMTFPVIAGG